jgi:hypothetical protein
MRSFLDLNKNNFPLYLDQVNKEITAPDGEHQPRTDTTWL